MKTPNLLAMLIAATLSLFSCQKNAFQMPNEPLLTDNLSTNDVQDYLALRCYNPRISNDVAVQWVQLEQKLLSTTAGFGNVPTTRFFNYSGIAMYEALLPSLSNYESLAPQVGGIPSLPIAQRHTAYNGPLSINAAIAQICRNFFSATSAANKAAIDSLETVFKNRYQNDINAAGVQRSIDFGKQVATAVFDWSKTDGTLATNPPYVPPVGAGLWVPTPPAFAPAAAPYFGTTRTCVQRLTSRVSAPAPPFPYSENPNSDFYKMVHEVYDISQHLTPEEINIAKTWADVAGSYNSIGHYANIVTQLITNYNLDLPEAVVLYAKSGIAMNDAHIFGFKIKYQYNQLRPITYIRSVLGQNAWNSVVPTPAHPEYLSNHALIGQSLAEVLKAKFGNRIHLIDRTNEALYDTRTFNSIDAIAQEGAHSRILGGIHFKKTADLSLSAGAKIGRLVNRFRLKEEHR
jgi:hypothetical protein